MRLGPGRLYSPIQALLEEKLIEEVDLREEEKLGHERHRSYRLTSAGRKLARSEAERLADLLRVAQDKNNGRKIMSEKILAGCCASIRLIFAKHMGRQPCSYFATALATNEDSSQALRLWLDLLADLAISVPRQYQTS